MCRKKSSATFLSILILGYACVASAQAPAEVSVGRLTIGARGGFTMSWMTFADEDLVREVDPRLIGTIQTTASRRYGGSGGVTVAYAIRSGWDLETGALYATTGTTIRGSDELVLREDTDVKVWGTITETYDTQYWNVPVLVKASFGSPRSRYYLGAGATFGFLVGATRSEEVRLNAQATADKFGAITRSDIENEMNGSSTSLSFVAGWAAGHGRVRSFVELGYDFGLTGLFPDAERSGVKHRGFTLMAGAGF